eukprot:638926-Prymnesium_polylepis.1
MQQRLSSHLETLARSPATAAARSLSAAASAFFMGGREGRKGPSGLSGGVAEWQHNFGVTSSLSECSRRVIT